MHGSILKAVKAALPQAKALVQSKIDYINQQMAIHNTSAFLLNVVNAQFPLNLTTTRAPILEGSTNLITIDFDGTVYDSAEKTNHVQSNSVFPERVTDSDKANSHQIFLHQSTLGSAFFAVNEKLFPLSVNNTNVTDQFLTFFFEIKNHYGANTKTEIEFTVLADNGDFITVNKSAGIEIGKKSKAGLQLNVFCSNETVTKELAVEFTMDLEAVLNITEDNYYVYANVAEITLKNVTIVQDKVGMFARDYNTMLNMLAMTGVQNFNDQWSTPYDFRTIDPQLMFFITTVFSKPRVSPFYMDEFLYMGISYQFDFAASPLTYREKAHLESQYVSNEHSEKLLKFYNLIMAKYYTVIEKFQIVKAHTVATQ
jgi:hypothetical protein